MFRLRFIMLCSPLVGVTSCTHFAKFNSQPLDVDSSAAKLTNRSLHGKTWTLVSLTQEAVKSHPTLAVAHAKYDTALAAVRSAGERPNPTLALAPQIVTPFKKWTEGTYGFDFDWTFETAGKRSKRVEIAESQVRSAAANVVDATWKVRSAVRKAFLEVYSAEQKTKLLNEAIAMQDELLKAYEERVKAGSESRSATTQARLLRAQMRLQAAESAKLASVARASLSEALGMSLQGLEGARFNFAAFDSTKDVRPSRKQALTHRADVLAALADYAGTEGLLRLEIAKQYPDLHLNPGYSLDTNQNKWALGIGLTLPILNHNQGAIGEAEAKRKEAAASFDAVQAKVLAEYDRAAASVAASRTKLATTDALLEEQAQQIASEQRLMDAGSGDRAALLSAKVEKAATLAARVEALADIQSALGELETATQTPIP